MQFDLRVLPLSEGPWFGVPALAECVQCSICAEPSITSAVLLSLCEECGLNQERSRPKHAEGWTQNEGEGGGRRNTIVAVYTHNSPVNNKNAVYN